MENFDLYKFVGSLGLFFLGMVQLENSLKNIAGRKFKNFLKEHTTGKFKSILSGAFVTAVLQSSSLVSLIALAFIGSGLISLSSAIGIILGANLGTTLTGWIFTYIGFKLNVSHIAYSLLFLGSFLYFILEEDHRLREVARFLLGFGLLFIGLEGMKESMSVFAQSFDITLFQGHSIFIYALVGFILTAIIQSSSACMVIVLAALDNQMISFLPAASMIVGADLGTTLTVFLGSINGSSDKKRMALSHFMYNFIVDVLVLISIKGFIYFITNVLNIVDPLVGLVAFHTTFNLLGIFIFVPFLEQYTRWIESFFKEEKIYLSNCHSDEKIVVIEHALENVEKETILIFKKVLRFNKSLFDDPNEYQKFSLFEKGVEKSFRENYYELKSIESEVYEYVVKIKQGATLDTDLKRADQLLQAIRAFVYSSKGIKDVQTNLNSLNESTGLLEKEIYHFTKDAYQKFLYDLDRSFKDDNIIVDISILKKLRDDALGLNRQLFENLRRLEVKNSENGFDYSSYFNLITEIHTSNISLLRGLEDLILDRSKAQHTLEHVEVI